MPRKQRHDKPRDAEQRPAHRDEREPIRKDREQRAASPREAAPMIRGTDDSACGMPDFRER